MAKLTSSTIKKSTTNSLTSGLGTLKLGNLTSAMQSALKNGLSTTTSSPVKATFTTPVEETTTPAAPVTEEKKETQSTYVAPTVDTSAYDRMIAAYETKMRADAEAAKKAKAAEYDAQAKAAYIARLQNERTLTDRLAQAGIRGGTTETSNARLLSNYENNRNQIEASKSSALTGIDKDASDKIFEYTQTQEAAKLAYLQAREAETRQIAETMRQEQWTASQNALEREYNSSEAEKARQFTTSERLATEQYNAYQAKLEREAQDAKEKAKREKEEHDAKVAQIRADYIATVERFRTEAQCDAELKRLLSLKKKGSLTDSQYRWRMQYVQLQKSNIQTKEEEEKKAEKKK